MKKLDLCAYDINVQIESNSVPALENLKKDFLLYLAVNGRIENPCNKIKIEIYKEAPPYKRISPLKASFQENTQIVKISKIRSFAPFITSGVFGLGLPQIAELFLRCNFKDVLKKIGVVFSRSLVFFFTICRTSIYEIKIGRNLENSMKEMSDFLYKD